MPVYEYKGQHYDLSETDPAAAKAKIQAHLGETTAAAPEKSRFERAMESSMAGRGMVGGPPTPEEASKVTAGLKGAGYGTLRDVGAIGGLIPGISKPSEQLAQFAEKRLKESAQTEPFATGAGEFASYFLPYEGALKGVRAGRALGRAVLGGEELARTAAGRRAATSMGRIGEQVAAGGITGFATTPGSMEERGKAAKEQAEAAGLLTAVPEGVVGAIKGAVGIAPEVVEAVAKKWEARGYKLAAPQLRGEKPIVGPGRTDVDNLHNENLATREVTERAGDSTEKIDKSWFNRQAKKFEKEYGRIFGRSFTIDNDAAEVLRDAALFERSVNPAGSSAVEIGAMNLYGRWHKEAVREFAERMKRVAERKREKIAKKIARRVPAPTPGAPAPPPGQVPPRVTAAAGRDWSSITPADSPAAPEWARRMHSVLTDLGQKMGIRDMPEIYVGDARRFAKSGNTGVYYPGLNFMIIHAGMDSEDALLTAYHEYGHAMEFQWLHSLPASEMAAVRNAWAEETTRLPFGTITMGQARPLTYAFTRKYPAMQGIMENTASLNFDKGYLRSFSEWWAEQTSRFLTTDAKPVTLAEKVFAKAAEFWKSLYAKVLGYTPLKQEVSALYNKYWNAGAMPSHFANDFVESGAVPDLLKSIQVSAKIDGRELQRIRSKIADVARSDESGNVRKAAKDLLQRIDDSIVGAQDKTLLSDLQRANRQYTVVRSLEKGVEDGWVSSAGKVSLTGLGDHLAGDVYGFGSGTTSHPLQDLGYEGRILKLTHREQGTKYPGLDAGAALFGRARQAAFYLGGAYSPLGRPFQRALSSDPESVARARAAAAEAAGYAGAARKREKQLNQQR